eukprot:scaffold249325_cov30-Tisochrysis_lutea.AAC.17
MVGNKHCRPGPATQASALATGEVRDSVCSTISNASSRIAEARFTPSERTHPGSHYAQTECAQQSGTSGAVFILHQLSATRLRYPLAHRRTSR